MKVLSTLSIMMPQRTVLVSAPIPLLALVLSPLGAIPGVMWPYIRVLCLYCAVPYCTCEDGPHVVTHPHMCDAQTRESSHHAAPDMQTQALCYIPRHTYRGRWCRRQTSNCKLQLGNLHNIIPCSLIFDLNVQQIKHVIDMSILILGSQDPAFCVLTIHEIVWESLHLVQNFSNKP